MQDRSHLVYMENPPPGFEHTISRQMYDNLVQEGEFDGMWSRIGACQFCGITILRFSDTERGLSKVASGPEHELCDDPQCIEEMHVHRKDNDDATETFSFNDEVILLEGMDADGNSDSGARPVARYLVRSLKTGAEYVVDRSQLIRNEDDDIPF